MKSALTFLFLIASYAYSAEIDFGGMYGTFVNPLTSGFNCPSGYQASKVYGSPNLDGEVYFCYRNSKPGIMPEFDFGGMFGFSLGGPKDASGYFDGEKEILFNPATAMATCPQGYNSAPLLGTKGKDLDVSFCYRRHEETGMVYDFGGMYGSGAHGAYNNPLTQGKTCPQGYGATDVLGTSQLDYPLFFCARLRNLDAKTLSENHIVHVSSTGQDSWSGSLPWPNSARTDGPFRTLERARDAIRLARKTQGSTRPYIIYLRGGRHERSRVFQLNEEDSGNLSSPLIISSYPGESAEITGSIRLPSLVPQSSSRASVSLASLSIPQFRTLFVNGKRAQRARTPNQGYFPAGENLYGEGQKVIGLYHYLSSGQLAGVSPSTEIIMLKEWMQVRGKVETSQGQTLTVSGDVLHSLGGANDTSPGGFYLENYAGALDAAGEWYLDPLSKNLSYMLRPGEVAVNLSLRAPITDQLISIAPTSSEKFVDHIRIERLILSETDWTMDPSMGHVGSQSGSRLTDYSPMSAERTRNLIIKNLVFRSLGGSYALHTNSQSTTIASSVFYDLAGGAIRIGPRQEGPGNINTSHRIVMNRIQHSGKVFKSPSAIYATIVRNTSIEDNTIVNVPYTGISLGWAWTSRDAWPINNSIKRNRVIKSMSVLRDGGGIYTLGSQPESVVSGNFIQDTGVSDAADYPLLDFGGMFGFGQINGTSITYLNPATGKANCPSSYTQQQIYGTPGIDHQLFLCYRHHIPGEAPVLDLRTFMNAKSQAAGLKMNCPGGYNKHQVFGTDGVDDSLYICTRLPVRSSQGYSRGSQSFGGLVGTVSGRSVAHPLRPNPKGPCPSGYVSRVIMGTSVNNVDSPLSYCMSPKTMAYGIYLDEGSKGFSLSKNEIQSTFSSGIFLHFTTNVDVINNYIINSEQSGIRSASWLRQDDPNEPVPSQNRIIQNIIYAKRIGSMPIDLTTNMFSGIPMVDTIEKNILFSGTIENSEELGRRMVSQGQNFFSLRSSLFTDPLLDLNSWGSYRPTTSSPAVELGIGDL